MTSQTTSAASPHPRWSCGATRDAYCPRDDQDAIASGIAGARLSVFEGAGHAPHWEQPERFASELASFVGG